MKRRRFVAVTVGALVLSVGLVLATGSGVTYAKKQDPPQPNPLTQILNKLDEILAAIAGLGGGGGGNDGNHTLRWDQALPAAQRFVILAAFNNDAVLDKNTGLVWEKSPATTPAAWVSATATCINKNVGNQKGWRLPAIAELASLIDPTVPSPGPTLPPGHPFLNVQSVGYWSASSYADNPAYAWRVYFNSGDAAAPFPYYDKNFVSQVWCVRGGMNADQY